MFAPVAEVAKLHYFVNEANYDEAEKMVNNNLKLIVDYVLIKRKNEDGTYKYEITSPLRLSFENLDTYMWKMFLEKIIGCENIRILINLPDDLEEYKESHILVSGKHYFINASGLCTTAGWYFFRLWRGVLWIWQTFVIFMQ